MKSYGEMDPAGASIQGARKPLLLETDADGQSTFFRSLPVAVLITDSSTGRVLEANDACLDLLGVVRDRVIGKTLIEAGLGFVVDQGRKGRALGSSVASITDSAGAKVSCRLYTSSVTIGGLRTVISVLLDDQMENAVRGRKKVEPAPREAGPRSDKPLALLVLLPGSEGGSTGDMLQLLGFDVVTEKSPRLALELIPSGRTVSMTVLDSPADPEELDRCLSEIVKSFPNCPVVLLVDPAREMMFSPGVGRILLKPVSINELADAASRR